MQILTCNILPYTEFICKASYRQPHNCCQCSNSYNTQLATTKEHQQVLNLKLQICKKSGSSNYEQQPSKTSQISCTLPPECPVIRSCISLCGQRTLIVNLDLSK
ncbi:hypothetical protein BsWGS_04641 [Bradybaena similaris]